MRSNLLKHKLAAGLAATIVAPTAPSAGLVEVLGHMGFDGVFLDCEHGSSSWEQVEDMVRAAELAGYSSVVRVERNNAAIITRALDRGAGGVQVPHINTRSQAEAAVQHVKFAPLGHRGWSGGRTAFGVEPGDYARHANAETLLTVMLEEVEALENLDEILKVENVDVFFVAPGDLAQSMGHPGETEHPQVLSAIEDALQRIRAAGRVSGALTTPRTLDWHLQLGVQYLYVAMTSLLAPGAADFVNRAERFGK